MSALRVVPACALALLLVGPLFGTEIAWSSSVDNNPKVLLHVAPPVLQDRCSVVPPLDCSAANTAWALTEPCFVYLLVARQGLPDLAGLECGITYQGNEPAGQEDHRGLDILSWTLCATMEFTSASPHPWPAPGSGNLVTWNTTNACQTADLAVAGYFYVSAYTPDELRITPRPASGKASVATCSAIVKDLRPADLGTARFTAGAGTAGCNPCVAPCGPAPPPSLCEVSPLVLDFHEVTVGETGTLDLVITNESGVGMSGTVTEDGTHFAVVGTPDYTIPAGGSAVVPVAFTATSSGYETCTFRPGNGCPDVPAVARAVPAIACAMTPEAVDFGYVPVGLSADRTITIENQGEAPFDVDLQVCYLWWPDPQFSVVGDRSFTLGPGESASPVIRYSPSEKAVAACQVSTGLAGCRMIDLLGTGIPDFGCRVTPELLDFGEPTPGQPAFRSFQIRNLGGPPISGTLSFQENPDGRFSIAGNPSYSLAAGQSQYFTVVCSPVVPGALDARIDTGCDTGVRCFGYAQAPGLIYGLTNPSTLVFPYVAVGDTAYLPFTVTNNGFARIVGRIDESSDDFFVPEPDIDLEYREIDTLLVVFTPTVRSLQICTIHVPGSGTLTCSGNTVALPPLAVQPDFLNFGSVSPGDSAILTFSVTNGGTSPLGGEIDEGCPEFQVPSDAVALGPGETGTFQVVFKPASVGRKDCDLRLLGKTVVRCVANQAVPVFPSTWSAIKSRYMSGSN